MVDRSRSGTPAVALKMDFSGSPMAPTIRRKSRRQVRNSVATRAAILDAAEHVFAHKGLHATRTEDIALKSGVTKAMIHYYFTTKEKLYQAVLDRVFRERVEGIDFASLQHLPPLAALKMFIDRLLLQMCQKPHLGPLFALENAQNDGAYYNRSGGALYRALTEIIERGVRQGDLRRLDPRHTAINIMGASVHYFNVSANVRILWPKHRHRGELMREHARSVSEFIIHAVATRTAQ